VIRCNLPCQQSEQAATVIIVRYVLQVNLCLKSDVYIIITIIYVVHAAVRFFCNVNL